MQKDTMDQPTVLLESFRDGDFGSSYRFEDLERVITARTAEEVLPALAEVESAVADGRHAAGFISYEAAPALNSTLETGVLTDFPLLWFGIFAKRVHYTAERHAPTGKCAVSGTVTETDRISYDAAIGRIKNAIAAGESYQVNYTIGQRFDIKGDPFALYRRICRSQQAPFSAWLNIGSHKILSASPELFFSLRDGRLTMRPMKGTARRMPLNDDDSARRNKLTQSIKNQAENLMIVDLVRNDLSLIAQTGSVAVPRLFEIETYPTVHQMTSTVTANLQPGLSLTEIFRALFPCGSITGAPKRRTMEIIHELEPSPRGLYCGAIGYVSPGGEATFSVAIRTAVIDASTNTGHLGIGSGITWDSDAADEFQECLDKGAFLHRDLPPFSLIESLRHDSDGYLLLERHLKRLTESARHLGFDPTDTAELQRELSRTAHELHGIHKVRILLAADGTYTIEAQEINPTPPLIRPVRLSEQRVASGDLFLYHKTTNRALYDRELESAPECYDIIFMNERDEITEGGFNNIVISANGELLTPAIRCGLLPGVLREKLIESGGIREAIISPEQLLKADRIWLINSVRGWTECKIQGS